MTNEEAIKVLEQMKGGFIAVYNGNPVMYGFSDYVVQAFDMAIEALKIDLVRCGECKHRASGKMGKMCYGRHPDDFCSYGERRSDDDV